MILQLGERIGRGAARASATAAALLTILAALASAQTGTGGFSGTIVDESGRPFAGVKIPYRRVTGMVMNTSHVVHNLVPRAGEPIAGGTISSNANGEFSASGLPAGRYYICVSPPSDLYADPCIWNLCKVAFNVAGGVTTSLKSITIYAGVRVNFIIADAQQLLPTSGTKLGPSAVVGALSPGGAFRSAAVVSRNGSSIQATVTVPRNQPVQPWFFSRTLKLLDGSGRIIGPGLAAPVTLPSGITDYNVPLTVTK